MNIYIPKQSVVINAFMQVFGLFSDGNSIVASIDDADLVLVVETSDLRANYRADKFFGLLALKLKEVQANQPENVFVLDTTNLFGAGNHGVASFKARLAEWQDRQRANSPVAATEAVQKPSDAPSFSRRYEVLVIDDTEANRQGATLLLGDHRLSVVSSVQTAVKLLDGKKFDAVLTDMHLPPDKLYGALNLERYGVTETVPYGFAVVFEATSRGVPVAVVTDANHHQDWVSAMFDNVHDARVNRQRVLFFNRIGKRWDLALKALLEP